jgi:hypothetical protein
MKIETSAKASFNAEAVKRPYQAGKVRSLQHAGGVIRLIASRSIRVTKRKPGQPGGPPNSRGGAGSMKSAIAYALASGVVVIGYRFSVIGTVGAVHEFGQNYKGQQFDKRPTLGPALERAIPRIPEGWRSILR